jgi:hypothetical protein
MKNPKTDQQISTMIQAPALLVAKSLVKKKNVSKIRVNPPTKTM